MTLDLNGINVSQFLWTAINAARCKNPYDTDFMFELGEAVIIQLMAENDYMYMALRIDEINQFEGVPIKVNYKNPCMFKLWKDVTLGE